MKLAKYRPGAGLPDFLISSTVLNFIKLPRSKLISSLYCLLHESGQAKLIRDLNNSTPNNMLCVVAFNLPWAVDLMIRCCQKFLPEWQLVVFDNSNKPQARREIASICRKGGVLYLPLPRNPEWSPNRSHGLALNWIYRNVVSVVRPQRFGFLDHNCFPTDFSRIPEHLDEQPIYGLLREPKAASEVWTLLAGYMFFRYSSIGSYRLDFGHDQIRNLDTGGRNWNSYFRYLDRLSLRFAETRTWKLRSADFAQEYIAPCVDSFCRIGGVSYRGYDETGQSYLATVRNAIESKLISAP